MISKNDALCEAQTVAGPAFAAGQAFSQPASPGVWMSLFQRVGRFFAGGDASTRGSATAPDAADPGNSAVAMTDFLIGYIPVKVKLPPGTRLTPDTVLAELGVDSLAMIRLSDELEQRLAVTVAPELLFEAPTLTALAAVLHEARLTKAAAPAAG